MTNYARGRDGGFLKTTWLRLVLGRLAQERAEGMMRRFYEIKSDYVKANKRMLVIATNHTRTL